MANLEHVGRRSAERAGNSSLALNNHSFWRRLEPWLPAIIIGLGLALWELLSRTGQLSALFFPAPSTIIASLIQMILNGKLAIHLRATIERLVIGFAIGGSAGLLLGLAMGWSPRLRQIVDPLIAAIHPIPKIAIFPLIMIIFGIGEASKIVAISIAAFFPMLLNCMSGVRQLNPVYFEVTQNYRASRWKTFSRLIVPGSLPLILTGTRLAINMAMVIAIAVELLAAKEGLGVIIWFSWQTLRIEELYASLVVIAGLGVGINLFLQYLSKRLTPWYIDQTDRQY
jgi:ABC-type nitrate/sulfonate/bicarbonate transport system permease component